MRFRATVIQDETGKTVAVRIFDVSDREPRNGRVDIDLEVHTDDIQVLMYPSTWVLGGDVEYQIVQAWQDVEGQA
jgi:hypothetical protein